jgi:hypothetical protein
MDKKGFFVFEPLIVLVFISALVTAATITLEDTTTVISRPLARHAGAITLNYLEAENNLFIPRELEARYATQDAIYKLAGAGGQVNTDFGGCHFEGMGAPIRQPGYIDFRTVPVFKKITQNFREIIDHEFETEIDYEFIFEEKEEGFRLGGIPLKPEEIEFSLNTGGSSQGAAGEYWPRVSFTVDYNYPMKQIYDLISEGSRRISDCAVSETDAGVKLCVDQAIANNNIETIGTKVALSWSSLEVSPRVYQVDIVHNYQMPFCVNKPTTLLKIDLNPSI